MKTFAFRIVFCSAVIVALSSMPSHARGFGGFRGGGARVGGGGGGFGAFHSESFGGYRGGGSYSSSRSGSGYRGFNSAGYSGSYDRSWSGDHGGSVSVSGTRGAYRGPGGGWAAGGTRDVTAEGPGGRTYSSESQRGAAGGPWGNTVAGGSRTATASGRYGTVSGGSRWGAAEGAYGGVAAGTRWGAAGTARFPSDVGLSRYSSVAAGGFVHSTAYWPRNTMVARAGYVRGGFVHYNGFTAGWYAGHPVAWCPSAWTVNSAAAWAYVGWNALSSLWRVTAPPVYYDYGNTIVYQNNSVIVNGETKATAEDYAAQATTIAQNGRAAQPPAQAEWHSLGVFAIVQGDEKTSNNIFQLAVDGSGTIRGNYCDAIMDTTTPVYGSVDKLTQRAAWSTGDNKETVFETGIYNLTKDETPVLVHFGKDRTQQWMLVRLKKPSGNE